MSIADDRDIPSIPGKMMVMMNQNGKSGKVSCSSRACRDSNVVLHRSTNRARACSTSLSCHAGMVPSIRQTPCPESSQASCDEQLRSAMMRQTSRLCSDAQMSNENQMSNEESSASQQISVTSSVSGSHIKVINKEISYCQVMRMKNS